MISVVGTDRRAVRARSSARPAVAPYPIFMGEIDLDRFDFRLELRSLALSKL
jgi:hypothetical protein